MTAGPSRLICTFALLLAGLTLGGGAGDGGCGDFVKPADQLCADTGGTWDLADHWPATCGDDPATTTGAAAKNGERVCLCPADKPNWTNSGGCQKCAVKPKKRYVIAISYATWGDAGWQDVAKTLEIKHQGEIVLYNPPLLRDEVIRSIADFEPSYIAVVATPQEASEQFVRDWHQLVRRLDDDPYGDAVWAIITGINSAKAKQLAAAPGPLRTRRALTKGVGDWLPYFTNGTYHAVDDTSVKKTRTAGGAIVETRDSPVDDTMTLVNGLNANNVDIFMTTGHASEYAFQLHYPNPEPEGYLKSSQGQLYGRDAAGGHHDINTTNPKIFYAPGNCLIGHIAEENPGESMALGWLGSGGAVQMGGYVVPTWFGYMGWELSYYFLPGRYTFAQSAFLNNQALLFDQRNQTGRDAKGLDYDRDVFVVYGDPAYDARTEGLIGPAYEQKLTYDEVSALKVNFTLTIKVVRAENSNKAQITMLPFRIGEPVVTNAAGRKVDVTDNMVLTQIWRDGERNLKVGDAWTIQFSGRPRKHAPAP